MREAADTAGARRPLATPSLLLATGATAAAAVLSLFDPNAVDSILPPCPWHALTGLYCPGCGSTRALHALVHGDPAYAWTMNPLLVLALPALALMALNAAGWKPRGSDRIWQWLGKPKLWLWTLLGYAVVRNFPWWPFSWLAPG